MPSSEKNPVATVAVNDAAPAAKIDPKQATMASSKAKAIAGKVTIKAPAKAQKTIKATVATKVVKAPKIAKPSKEKKVKMVRDSFTFPKPEFEVLATLKLRAAKLETTVKKTELIRAGIKALAGLSDAAFVAAVRSVPNLKTGRPAKTA